MIAIAKCESGLNPDALNTNNPDGTHDGGLFQINSTHHGRMRVLGLDWKEPEDNVQFAKLLYDESGTSPWVCADSKHLSFNR